MKKPLLLSLLAVAGLLALFVLRTPFAAQSRDRDVAVERSVEASEYGTDERRTAAARPTRLLSRETVTTSTAANRPSSISDSQAAESGRDVLRAPIINAIRSTGPAEQKRRAMLDAIRSSGESDDPWTAEAEVAFENWRAALPVKLAGRFSVAEPLCYQAGCMADVTFEDEASERAAAQAFRSLAESGAAHGGRVQTPAESVGTKRVATWIMLRPQDD